MITMPSKFERWASIKVTKIMTRIAFAVQIAAIKMGPISFSKIRSKNCNK